MNKQNNTENISLLKKGRIQYNQLMMTKFPKGYYLKITLLSYLIALVTLLPVILLTVQVAVIYGYWFISSTFSWIIASLLISIMLLGVNGYLVFLNLYMLKNGKYKILKIDEYEYKPIIVSQILNPYTFVIMFILLFLLGGMMF